MTKIFEFELSEWDTNSFFKPIRKKEDYIELLMQSMRFMIISHSFKIDKPKSRMILQISKMGRLIYISDTKIFSVAFPFAVDDSGSGLKFNSAQYGEIDSVAIANVLSVLKEESPLAHGCISGLADFVLDISAIKPAFWFLLKEIFFLESGYLRFDHDSFNENKNIHPLNHIDVFYSSKATFKIGLNGKLNSDTFFDILDIETDCHFLNKC